MQILTDRFHILQSPLFHLFRHLAHIHIACFPDMPIKILESPAIHPTIILRISVFFSASCYDLLYHLIDFFSAVRRQAQKRFGTLFSIANLSSGNEAPKEFLYQQHHKYIFLNDHAGCILVSKLRIELEAELGEERYGFLKVPNGQVYKNLSWHAERQ